MSKKTRTKANKKKKEERPTVERKHTGTVWKGFNTHLSNENWIKFNEKSQSCETTFDINEDGSRTYNYNRSDPSSVSI